jgi:hypothetical protein
MAGTSASAQYTVAAPATANFPWNNYIPSRIADGFQSIIGNGGTLVSGSNNRGAYDYVSALTLPFNFYFLNTTYASGFSLKAGTCGYLSFNGSSYTGGPTYNYYGYYWISNLSGNARPSYNKMILAYGAELQTSGVTDGGIYTLLSGSAPNRVFTVEWRAQGYSSPSGNPGNFQLKLYERNGNIEFFYGPASIIRDDGQYRYGAMIGIKNLGEPYYFYSPSGVPARTTPEPNRYMYFTNPAESPDTVAVTGGRMVRSGNYYYVEYYNFTTTNPLTHPGFPTEGGARIGFRASPVLDDVAADSVWLTPTVAANAYGVGASPTVNARFRNMGGNARQSVGVEADLYFNGILQASRTGTIFPASTPQFSSESFTFTPSFGPLGNTGIYEVRVYPTFAADQDQSNDTVRSTFYISKPNDLMPYDILQPFANAAPLFTKYPLGVSVPIEVRYLNIGTNPQFNAKVGYRIYDAAGNLLAEDSSTIAGRWDPISFKDVLFTPWSPTSVGRYYIKAYTALPGDEQPNNDIYPTTGAGKAFDVLYEIEASAVDPALNPPTPAPESTLPDGRPTPVIATFSNSGVSDVTNVPARVQIRNAATGALVYDRSVIVSDIVSDGGTSAQRFPDFTPNGSGRYCATAFITYASDPVRSNDTTRWCFNVAPRLTGTIRVGFGARFKTIEEARDSIYYYGIGSPVTFELTDDAYTVETSESTIPALDFRGRIVGLSASNPVVWRPVAGKTDVAITLRSASGYGIWFGQMDTSNADGYVTFDGGAGKALRFIYENTNTVTTSSAYNRAIPFYFGQGASNYTVKNVKIEPVTGPATIYRASALALPMPSFTQANQQFRFTPDVSTTVPSISVSAGIMLRNSAPIDVVAGRNVRNADTIRNQNNRFENNEIRGFGYGIVSVGIGPLFNVGTGRYVEYSNQNNLYTGNLIENVGRAGIAMVYEKGSEITDNTIRRVTNATSMENAAGIYLSSGGNASNNRGYSSDMRIGRNKVRQVSATTGTGAGVLVETSENVLNTPSNVIYRFPTAAATNLRIRNNSIAGYSGPTSIGIGLTIDPATRIDLVTGGNRIENNTLYSTAAVTGAGGASVEYGVYLERAGASVRNNIFALVSTTSNPVAVSYQAPAAARTIVSDHNLFWVPNGYVGELRNLSSQGYALPSGPRQKTLAQWRAASGFDINSVEGNITAEFVSTTPGSEDLHIRPNIVGSLAGNRGVAVSDLTTDIDRQSRGGAPVNGAFDIGADEFTGVVRNHDLMAEGVVSPAGYRSATGQFSDAEYIMTDSLVPLRARLRNVGGMPIVSNTVAMTVEYRNPASGSYTQVRRSTQNASADVASARDVDFGAFMPQTLRELGMSDPFYGINPNVSPLYRITITSGTDDFAGNNSYTKQVRFYLQRSTRKVLVAVESLAAAGTDAVTLSNRLNSDTLLAALEDIHWERTDGVGAEDFDLFERDRWPSENLDFRAWDILIWEQGSESEGLIPEERAAIKAMMSQGNTFDRKNLVIAGEDVARIHDVALTAGNGQTADQEFVRNYLRAQYIRPTVPADYSNRLIRGVTITPGKYEELEPTGVAGDAAPMPAVVRTTSGQGIATLSHSYTQQTIATADTGAGVSAASPTCNSVYYAFDWRHAGRFNFELSRSGAQRLLLGALDFIDQYGGVLPINLVSFDAYQASERAVNVEWVTARESEISSLEVERAEVLGTPAGESVGSFAVIDRVAPKGTPESGASYRINDRSVDVGRVYIYRLVSVNLEGVRTAEQDARVAVIGGTTGGYALTVLPNPVRTTGSVAYRAPRGERVTIELYDIEGGLVSTILSSTSEGEGAVAIDAGALASGRYTVRLRSQSGVTIDETLTVTK